MQRDLQIEIIRRGAELVLKGWLDGRNVAAARAALQAAVDEGDGDLVVHVGTLEIFDASGLGLLVGVHRRARLADRRLVLADVQPRQLRLLRATRLHRVLTVKPLAVA